MTVNYYSNIPRIRRRIYQRLPLYLQWVLWVKRQSVIFRNEEDKWEKGVLPMHGKEGKKSRHRLTRDPGKNILSLGVRNLLWASMKGAAQNILSLALSKLKSICRSIFLLRVLPPFLQEQHSVWLDLLISCLTEASTYPASLTCQGERHWRTILELR